MMVEDYDIERFDLVPYDSKLPALLGHRYCVMVSLVNNNMTVSVKYHHVIKYRSPYNLSPPNYFANVTDLHFGIKAIFDLLASVR